MPQTDEVRSRINSIRSRMLTASDANELRSLTNELSAVTSEFSWITDFGPLNTLLQGLNDASTTVEQYRETLNRVLNSVETATKTIDSIKQKFPNGAVRTGQGTSQSDSFYTDTDDIELVDGGIQSGARLGFYSSVRGFFIPKDFSSLADANGYDRSNMLIFQFNPDELNVNKESVYSPRAYTGLDYNDYIWSNGGEKNITFNLFFDATASSFSSNFRNTTASGFDVLDVVKQQKPRGVLPDTELLESYLRPYIKNDNGEIVVPQFSSGGIVTPKQFYPPPVLLFVYGEFYLEGVLKSADVKYSTFDKDLIPRRAEVNVQFGVLETVQLKISNDLKSFRA